VAALTAVSRVLGLVRDSACAASFGAGIVWDAFGFAFRIPNLFRRLFGEGALRAAFIPVFSERLAGDDKENAEHLVAAVAIAVVFLLVAFLVLGECFLLLLPRLVDLGERWRLAVSLTAVMMPYMIFICLTALAAAALNSLKHFAVPALAPVVLNLIWIAAVLLFAPLLAETPKGRILLVAAAIVAAGAAQLGMQIVALRATGFRWRPSSPFKDPGVRRIAVKMAPVALGLAAFQINVLLDGVIAISLAGPESQESFSLFGRNITYPMHVGANSVLYFGNRLMQLPLGVFGIALATVTFPLLSQYAAHRDWRSFSRALTSGLRAVIFIGIPAGLGLIVLRRPAVELLFQRGAFTPLMTLRTASVVTAYGAGIWAYCALHVLTRAFYSLKDMTTPVKVTGAAIVLNLCLNLLLIWPLAEAGLAAATAVSSACQVCVLYVLLRRRVVLSEQKQLLTTFVGTAAASAVMLAVCLATLALLPPSAQGDLLSIKVLRVMVPVATGGAAYLATARLLRMPEVSLALGFFRRRQPGEKGERRMRQ